MIPSTTNQIETINLPALQEFSKDIEEINKILTLVKEYLELRNKMATSNVIQLCRTQRKTSAKDRLLLNTQVVTYEESITTYKQRLMWLSHLTPITRELDELIEELNLKVR